MSEPTSVDTLLTPMTERVVDVHGAGFRVDRDRVLAGMAEAGERGRRIGVRYALLAAAGFAVVFGAGVWRREVRSSAEASLEVMVTAGSATQVRGATRTQVPLNRYSRIAVTGELETAANSNARIETKDGLKLELQSQTRVAVGELQPGESRVKLLAGAIRCSVAHRTEAHAFQVVTPDAIVVDLGTVFTVSLEGTNRATHVVVEEGNVLIQHSSGRTRVQAPNSWSSAPVVVEFPPVAGLLSAAPSASHPPEVRGTHSPEKAVNDKTPPETLGQEAQLLRQGLAAERQGRASDAILALTGLVTKYPQSPLVPDARAALARIEAGAVQR